MLEKDFERMLKLGSVENIKDYLYEITMSQDYDEAKDLLVSYLRHAILNNYKHIEKAILYVLKTSFNGIEIIDFYMN